MLCNYLFHWTTSNNDIPFSWPCLRRGISSTVRRCIEKETGREFAAKIIDLAMDSSAESSMNQMMEATRQEIAMLRHVMGHPYISEYTTSRTPINLYLCTVDYIMYPPESC